MFFLDFYGILMGYLNITSPELKSWPSVKDFFDRNLGDFRLSNVEWQFERGHRRSRPQEKRSDPDAGTGQR